MVKLFVFSVSTYIKKVPIHLWWRESVVNAETVWNYFDHVFLKTLLLLAKVKMDYDSKISHTFVGKE